MALQLGRRYGERIALIDEQGRETWITIVRGNSRNQVRVDIEAPDEIEILREEIYDKKYPQG